MMSRNKESYLKDSARSKVMCTGECRLQLLSVVCENTKIQICKTASAVYDYHGFTPVNSQAPQRHSLSHQQDWEQNQKGKR